MGHPQIAAFARLAEEAAEPVRRIEGQKTLLARTMHAIYYDEVHDEIIVPQTFAQAILTFRGGAHGEEPPIRVIQGSQTGLQYSDTLAVDPIHNEIFAAERNGTIHVFPREANGNVAPIRRLGGADTQLSGFMKVAVDPIHDLLIVSGGRSGLLIFNRTDSGNAKPKRIITGGPKSRVQGPSGHFAIYPPTGMIVATTSTYRAETDRGESEGGPAGSGFGADPSDSFVGAWSIEDNGDVSPRWTIVHNIYREARGVTLDPKNKTLIVSDKGLNAVMTFYFPEIF